jgi:prepilin-type N-terminal cleavage/methylation domain-containing protein
MARKNNSKGFTIIEVALVLAIAGLIFLVVFLALPALQRNQRDTGRRENVGSIVSGLQSYSSDNAATLDGLAGVTCSPDTDTNGICGYSGKLSQITKIVVGAATATAATALPAGDNPESTALVSLGFKCNGAIPTKTGATARNAAVVVKLENGGGAMYCANM